MQVLTLYEIDTRSNRFVLVINGAKNSACVARYWNMPRRGPASPVRGPSLASQQWSGEVWGHNPETAASSAKAEIESIDGPIFACLESGLYADKRRQAHAA